MRSLALLAIAVTGLGAVAPGLQTAANAATLFTKSGTMLPSDGIFFDVPTFSYNVPLEISLQLSRKLEQGESFSFDLEYSSSYSLYWDGDQIDYDYFRFTEPHLIQSTSGATFNWTNIYSHTSWIEDDWDGPHLVELKEYVTLEMLWLDDVEINSPFGWTVTVSGAVPEPASWALMIAGFGLVGAAVRQKRAAAL